jgi:hypothetical protein
MSSSFRLARLVTALTLLLAGCFPGTVLRCEVFEGDCAFVDKDSYVYLRAQNFDKNPVFMERGSSKDLTVLLTGSSESPEDSYSLEFKVSDLHGSAAEGFSVPPFYSVKTGSTQTLHVTVAPEVKPGIYQGQVVALRDSIYAVLDVAIAVPH